MAPDADRPGETRVTIAYFDCFNGASGDMIVGALVAAGADVDRLRRDLALLELDDVRIEAHRVQRQGITATKVDVVVRGQVEGPGGILHAHREEGPTHEHEHRHSHNHDHGPDHDHGHSHGHDHEPPNEHEHGHTHGSHDHRASDHEHGHHEHRTLAQIEARLSRLPEPARGQAIAIYRRLGEAEGRVHGTTALAVHFHEVGSDDAIVDVAAAVLAMQQLGVTEVQCSPLPIGSGRVRCDHGYMPVPVPAVVELTRGIPTYDNGETGEILTPTGAAILTTLATRFGPPPPWALTGVGYGAGTREGKRVPNLVRVMLGTPVEQQPTEALVELAANIDDLNPQLYAPLLEKLLAVGVLDVTLTPTQMKKGRPGIVLQALVGGDRLDAACELIFRETTTLGLRYHPVYRRVLDREHREVETPWGPVRVKLGRLDGQVVNVAPEFEDCRQLSERTQVPIKDVWQEALGEARRMCAPGGSGQS